MSVTSKPSMNSARPLRILVVCTANQCRSPMGEAILSQLFDDAGIAAVVRSCGRLGSGVPIDRHAVTVIRERGRDISAQRSRPIDAASVRAADLIITMERAHVRDIASVDMDSWVKTFPLKTLVARALAVGPRNGTDFGAWIGRIHDGRSGADMLDPGVEDDIADPLGGSAATGRSFSAKIESHPSQVVHFASAHLALKRSRRRHEPAKVQ